VDRTDFSLTTSGVVGASVGTASGLGTTYTVTVNTGADDGTIRLNLIDNDSIVDGASNPLGGPGAGNGNYTAGQSYTIDKTPPSVSISEPSQAVTYDDPISYTVTYTGASGVDLVAEDVELIVTTGTADGDIVVSEPKTTFTRIITIENISGEGFMSIRLAPGTSWDAAGNFDEGLPGTGVSEPVHVGVEMPTTGLAGLAALVAALILIVSNRMKRGARAT